MGDAEGRRKSEARIFNRSCSAPHEFIDERPPGSAFETGTGLPSPQRQRKAAQNALPEDLWPNAPSLLSGCSLRTSTVPFEEHPYAITEVALAAGFGSLSGFSRAFRHRYGASPRTYRKVVGSDNLIPPTPDKGEFVISVVG